MGKRNGSTEIRTEKEIRDKVYVTVREQTVKGLEKKRGRSVCAVYYCRFIRVYKLHCVTNIVFTHVQYTWENIEPVGLQFAVLWSLSITENSTKVSHFWGWGLWICKWKNVSWSDAKQWALCRGPCTAALCPGVDLPLMDLQHEPYIPFCHFVRTHTHTHKHG